jgi:hypothetical protein
VIDTVEAYAPGFEASVIARRILSPLDLERDFGLVGVSASASTSSIRIMNAKLFGPSRIWASWEFDLRSILKMPLDPSSGAETADYLARRIVAGRAGDAAAGMGRAAAHVEAGNGRS